MASDGSKETLGLSADSFFVAVNHLRTCEPLKLLDFVTRVLCAAEIYFFTHSHDYGLGEPLTSREIASKLNDMHTLSREQAFTGEEIPEVLKWFEENKNGPADALTRALTRSVDKGWEELEGGHRGLRDYFMDREVIEERGGDHAKAIEERADTASETNEKPGNKSSDSEESVPANS